ncbi:hypothetical protein D6445_23655 [Salmonella enterica subsp. enterica serovar Infantis]|nr:hypothetical protein [Salmonella enterica subsp. enterica serovar Infantis]
MGVNKRDEAAAPRSGERGKRGLLIPSRTDTVCFTAYASGENRSGGTRRKAIRPQGRNSAPPGPPFTPKNRPPGEEAWRIQRKLASEEVSTPATLRA